MTITPGTWDTEACMSSDVHYIRYITADGRVIAKVRHRVGQTQEEALANANAMAALPLLLASLREMTPPIPPADAPCHVGLVPQSGCAHCQRIARAHAALAAAEGRA